MVTMNVSDNWILLRNGTLRTSLVTHHAEGYLMKTSLLSDSERHILIYFGLDIGEAKFT